MPLTTSPNLDAWNRPGPIWTDIHRRQVWMCDIRNRRVKRFGGNPMEVLDGYDITRDNQSYNSNTWLYPHGVAVVRDRAFFVASSPAFEDLHRAYLQVWQFNAEDDAAPLTYITQAEDHVPGHIHMDYPSHNAIVSVTGGSILVNSLVNNVGTFTRYNLAGEVLGSWTGCSGPVNGVSVVVAMPHMVRT